MTKSLYSLVSIILGCLVVTSCASVKVTESVYSPPDHARYSNLVNLPYNYDTAWSKLIKTASQTFFDIENFEKDSGLITLNFGTDDVEVNVNCGEIDGVNYVHIRQGQPDTSLSLSGKMNLLVEKIGEHSTRVTVKARYNLDMVASGYRCENPSKKIETCKRKVPYSENTIWTFDSNSTDSAIVRDPAKGTSTERTCAPTGEIEKLVIMTIENA